MDTPRSTKRKLDDTSQLISIVLQPKTRVNSHQLVEWKLQHLLQQRHSQDFENDYFQVCDLETRDTGKSFVMLNQNTHIKVFNHRQRIVFVIDMSQSMLTVDVSDRARVNMTTAFETVCKTVDGLLRPFEFVTQFREATVQPDLRITVVGDPGPDGLIRVLMQDIPITRQQFDPFIEKLYDLMIEFENELLEKRTKTDYSSFRSLGDALLMLDLDPDDRQQTIVFLTNGVCCAGSDRKEICSRMVSRMVHVVVIQIGAPDGFTPSAEFGRVSNMDWVQFLVQACNGLFIYSGDCPYTQDQTDPNFYHLLYLFKPELGSHTQQEYPLRPVDELPVRLINSNHSNQQTKDEQGFPWLKDTKAPGITKILCGYKDYKIPFQQLKHLIHSRLSQGFILQHCKHRKKTEKNSEKLELTFVLYWLPNVNVDYTIKIYWESNTDLFQGDRKPIRVELNVLAHHSFAVLFINVHDIESQDVKNSLHNRLVQLHKFLRDIYETDETIKFLTENPSASNYWQILSQFLMIKPDILDTKRLSVVLQSTSQLVHQSDRAVQVANGSVEQGRSRRQVATIYLYQHLARWASFVWNKTFYIKMTETGYCFLQVIWETESLVSIVGSFMGLDLPMQDQVWQSLEQEISGIVHLRNQKPFSPIIVYRKPLDLLIVYEKIQARPFLRSKTWEWFHNMQSSKPLTRMVQLGFQMLYQDRLEEGFKHLAESVGSATFCKSVQVQERELVIQYCIEWNLSKNTLKTQLWMETSWIYDNGFMDWFEKIQQKIYYRDCLNLTRLSTFYYIDHYPDLKVSESRLINILSLLKTSRFLVLGFDLLDPIEALKETESKTIEIPFDHLELESDNINQETVVCTSNSTPNEALCYLFRTGLKAIGEILHIQPKDNQFVRHLQTVLNQQMIDYKMAELCDSVYYCVKQESGFLLIVLRRQYTDNQRKLILCVYEIMEPANSVLQKDFDQDEMEGHLMLQIQPKKSGLLNGACLAKGYYSKASELETGVTAQISNLFSISLAQAVYYSIVTGNTFTRADFDRGFAVFEPVKIQIDLTHFVGVIGHGYPKEYLSETLVMFESIVERYFAPIPERALFYHKINQDHLERSKQPLYVSFLFDYHSQERKQSHEMSDLLFDSFEPILDNERKSFLELSVFSLSKDEIVDQFVLELEQLFKQCVLKGFLTLESLDMRQHLDYLFREAQPLDNDYKIISHQFSPVVDYFLHPVQFLDLLCLEYFQKDIGLFPFMDSRFEFKDNFYYFCNQSVCIFFSVSHLSINLHLLSLDNKQVLLEQTLKLVEQAVLRANRRFALYELYEQHRARDELIPLEGESDLSCQVQFQMLFSLHWRLKPEQALNALLNSLNALSISNRKGYLCLVSHGEIYYMNLSIFDNGIILRIFGLDKPNQEIQRDFVNMIELKIRQQTQNILSLLLARNPNVKITRADADFLIPPQSLMKPAHQTWFLLPPRLENPFLFMLLLRQAMLLYTRPFIGPEVVSNLLRFYKQFSKLEVEDEFCKHCPNEFHVNDFTFIYNCVPNRLVNSLESLVGQGMMVLNLSMYDNENKLLYPSKFQMHYITQEVDLKGLEILETNHLQTRDYWTGYKIEVCIWNHGVLNMQQFTHQITKTVNQTNFDYCLESYYRTLNKDNLQVLPTLLQVFETVDDNPLVQSIVIPSLDQQKCFKEIHDVLKNEGFESLYQYGSIFVGSIHKERRNSVHSDFSKTSNLHSRQSSRDSLDSMISSSSKFIDLDEVNMIPDMFYPEFPEYRRRGSFFLISVDTNCSCYTYNWKKSESTKLFMQLVKILLFTKISRSKHFRLHHLFVDYLHHQMEDLDKLIQFYSSIQQIDYLEQTVCVPFESAEYRKMTQLITNQFSQELSEKGFQQLDKRERRSFYAKEDVYVQMGFHDTHCIIHTVSLSLMERIQFDIQSIQIQHLHSLLKSNVDLDFDLIRVLKSLSLSKSKHFVISCVYESDTFNLYDYILKNANSYDFSIVSFDTRPSGCCFTTKFDNKLQDFEFGLVFTQHEKLEYFVIVLDHSTESSDYLGDGYYLKDILKHFERSIDDLIQRAMKHFDRDHLWSLLLSHDPESLELVQSPEWTSLFLEKIMPNSKDLSLMSSVNKFLESDLPWDDVFLFLSTYYSKSCRLLFSKQDEQHLVIYNLRNTDYVLYLKKDTSVTIHAIHRQGLHTFIDDQLLNDVVNTILFYLWQSVSL